MNIQSLAKFNGTLGVTIFFLLFWPKSQQLRVVLLFVIKTIILVSGHKCLDVMYLLHLRGVVYTVQCTYWMTEVRAF